MKFFRTHIARSFSVGLLLAGLVFYFMKPVSTPDQHEKFAFWLQSNLKAKSNTDVAKQIRSLSSNSGELETVVREASALVKAHADDFELPIDQQSQDENEIFDLLISEWDAYQNSSNGMGKAVMVKQTHPQTVLPVDGISFGGKLATQATPNFSLLKYVLPAQKLSTVGSYFSIPLIGGTAINAP